MIPRRPALNAPASMARGSAGALLLLTLWLPTAQPARAQETTVHGAVEAVDRAIGTITVLVPPRSEPRVFSLTRHDLPVGTASGQAMKLSDLRKGQRVAVLVDGSGGVGSVRIDDHCMWGYVTENRPEERKLVIRTGYLERALSVPDGVPVIFDGKKDGRFSDLKAGQPVKAVFAPDERALLQLHGGRGTVGASPYFTLLSQSGILLRIDHGLRTFQILTQQGRFTLEEYEYRPWVTLRLIHSTFLLRTGEISTLQPYCKVHFNFESDSRRVVRVSAEAPRFARCRVNAVDRAGRRLAIEAEQGMQRLSVAADAVIRTPDGAGRWEDVTEESIVTCALTLDGREIVFIQLVDK